MSAITALEDGIAIKVHVQPGASKAGWAGVFGDALRLRVRQRALEGEANEAVRAFLAEFFSVSKSSVSIRHGLKSRQKIVAVKGPVSLLLEKIGGIVENG